jgi:protoporphyrinogen/coproporphyrinogen III oxidase
MTTPDAEPQLVIIGGGIAGLAAALNAQNHDLNYTLLEASHRWGGKLYTHCADIGRDKPLLLEGGPDGFITRKPWALTLANALGLQERVVGVNKTRRRIYILSRGRLVPMPAGLRLLVPTNIMAFLQSPLFTWPGKIRALQDLFIPAKQDAADESLATFITRRFGAEAVQRLAEPLLAGVYNADPQRMSIQATFGNYAQLEREHGSLIRGLWRKSQQQPAGQASTQPPLVSFLAGTGELVTALVAHLQGDMRLATSVTGIQRSTDGYQVALADGSRIAASHLIMATQANHAADLLRAAAPQAAERLAAIRYEGVGSAYVAYRGAHVPRALDAYGVVIPSVEGRRIDGMQWATTKWPGRAPDDVALLRVFFGGPQTRPMLHVDDADLLRIIREELRDLLGIQAEPLYHHILRWPDGYPQYDVGHQARVQAIRDALPADIKIVGNAYGGVGLPDTIHGAQTAIEQLSGQLKHKDEQSYANHKI